MSDDVKEAAWNKWYDENEGVYRSPRSHFMGGWDAAARTISDGGATDSLVARISTLEAQLAEAREALEAWRDYWRGVQGSGSDQSDRFQALVAQNNAALAKMEAP